MVQGKHDIHEKCYCIPAQRRDHCLDERSHEGLDSTDGHRVNETAEKLNDCRRIEPKMKCIAMGVGCRVLAQSATGMCKSCTRGPCQCQWHQRCVCSNKGLMAFLVNKFVTAKGPNKNMVIERKRRML